MKEFKKGKNDFIKFTIMLTQVCIMLSTTEQIDYIHKLVEDIKSHL